MLEVSFTAAHASIAETLVCREPGLAESAGAKPEGYCPSTLTSTVNPKIKARMFRPNRDLCPCSQHQRLDPAQQTASRPPAPELRYLVTR